MDQNEYRKHYYLDEFTIIAPNRNNRFKGTSVEQTVNIVNKFCPFCEISEPKVYAWPNHKDWQIAALGNKNPSLDFDHSKAYGYQEVIVEFSNHIKKLSDITEEEMFVVLESYQKRIKYILSFDNIEYLNVFKNVGRLAGASQEHLHSQIWALPLHPPIIRQEIAAVKEYKNNNNSCPVCDIIVDETEHDIRVLESNNHSVLLSPYSAKFVYEAWIIPTKHFSGFVDLDLKTLKSMAKQLHNYAKFLENKGFDYGIVVHDLYDELGHVYIKITPRVPTQIQASIEIESGIFINPVSPESVKTDYQNDAKV